MHFTGRALVRIPDAASRLGVGRTKIYDLIAASALDARKIGGRTVITEQSLQDFAASLPRARIAKSDPT